MPEQAIDISPDHEAGAMIRLHHSSVATAMRASSQLSAGLSLLGHQIERPKTAKWQEETAWILDGLRYSSLDGLDVQLALGASNPGAHKSDTQYLNRASRQAKQALLSSPTPMASAAALSKCLAPLSGKCMEVLNGLQKAVAHESSADTQSESSRRRNRASPSDGQGPSKKDL